MVYNSFYMYSICLYCWGFFASTYIKDTELEFPYLVFGFAIGGLLTGLGDELGSFPFCSVF